MMYSDTNGRVVAKLWGVPTSTLARWKRLGVIPDHRVLNKPLNKADIEVEQRLIKLIEKGWLKAKPISRLIGSQDKVNALLTARRYPNDPRYHVNHLSAAEIKKVKKLLDGLAKELGMLLYLASLTPDGQPYGDVIQAGLRAFMGRDYVSGKNARAEMEKRQESRFWGFMRGPKASREDIDKILEKTKGLLVLLS